MELSKKLHTSHHEPKVNAKYEREKFIRVKKDSMDNFCPRGIFAQRAKLEEEI